MVAYNDLNPVRACIVEDSADYKSSGYGEAVAGVKLARNGLTIALERSDKAMQWSVVEREYWKLLYEVGVEQNLREDGSPVQAGFTRKEALAEMKSEGRIPF